MLLSILTWKLGLRTFHFSLVKVLGVEQNLCESLHDHVVLSGGLFGNRLETVDTLTLGIDPHPFKTRLFVASYVSTKESSLHLQHDWPLI